MFGSRFLPLTVLALILLGGCGGSTPEIDDAEKIKEPTKPGEVPAPKPTPEVPAAKDEPKG
jgi:hypothetical protein